MPSYSFTTTIKKGIKYIVLFALPFIVSQFIAIFPHLADMTLLDLARSFIPAYWQELTVGGILVMLVNWLKVYIGMRLP